jgi:hypothetical protein
MANNFAKTSMAGVITGGLGSTAKYDLSSLSDIPVSMVTNQEVILTSTNWPGKGSTTKNVVLDFTGNSGTIPNLKVSWVVSGVTTSVTIPAGNTYYRISSIPDGPNVSGTSYSITVKALSGGNFKVKLTSA